MSLSCIVIYSLPTDTLSLTKVLKLNDQSIQTICLTLIITRKPKLYDLFSNCQKWMLHLYYKTVKAFSAGIHDAEMQ